MIGTGGRSLILSCGVLFLFWMLFGSTAFGALYDYDNDRTIDGEDLADFISQTAGEADLEQFSSYFGRLCSYVPDDHPTIQSAIDAAPVASVIFIDSGKYTENPVVENTLILRTIDGSDATEVTASKASSSAIY